VILRRLTMTDEGFVPDRARLVLDLARLPARDSKTVALQLGLGESC